MCVFLPLKYHTLDGINFRLPERIVGCRIEDLKIFSLTVFRQAKREDRAALVTI